MVTTRYRFDSSRLVRKAFLLALCATPLAYSQKNADALSHGDSSFLKDAAEGGMGEVKLGELAQQNGANDRVKMFGKHMVDDHTKAGNEIQALASRKGVTLPADISIKQKASYKLLSSKTGGSFDKSYMSSMVKDHQEDVAAFQKEADSGTDPDIKAFAAKMLPTLQEHLRTSQDVAHEVGVSEK